MWIDGDTKFTNLISSIEEDKKFPMLCPVCNEKSVHIYMHRFSDEGQRGGAWVWCSNCKTYTHFQYKVPDWWKNCSEIDFDKLCSNPSYLEKNKELIDEWINSLKN